MKTVFSEENYVPNNHKMPENVVKHNTFLSLYSLVPMLFLCKFGQNPSIGSLNRVQKKLILQS